MDGNNAHSDARAVIDAAEVTILTPWEGECLVCYCHRMLEEFTCDGTHRFAEHYRDVKARRATALIRKLSAKGACCCDCEMFLNTYILGTRPLVLHRNRVLARPVRASLGLVDPELMLWCQGVPGGSTQACANWVEAKSLKRRKPDRPYGSYGSYSSRNPYSLSGPYGTNSSYGTYSSFDSYSPFDQCSPFDERDERGRRGSAQRQDSLRAYGSVEAHEWRRPLDPDEENAEAEAFEIAEETGVEDVDLVEETYWPDVEPGYGEYDRFRRSLYFHDDGWGDDRSSRSSSAPF